MMMAWGMIGLAILVAVILAFVFAMVSTRRSAEKPKREDKPKREPRYELGDDGELVEIPDDDQAKPARSDHV